MKTTRFFTLSVALALAFGVYAYDFKSGDLYYDITSNVEPYTAQVTYQDDTSANYSGLTTVVIPSTVIYDGRTYSVTKIGDLSFYECSSLNSVTIPESVTRIGQEVFAYSGLSSMTMSTSVDSVGLGAFHETPWFNNLPDGMVYINNVLYTYKGTMPDNTSVVVADGTVAISNAAFEGCSGLTSITIAESVKHIDIRAFSYCTNLSSITFLGNVTKIGNWAFEGTIWWDNKPNGVVYLNDVLYTYKGTMPENTSIVIEDYTTTICDKAFDYCYGLTSVTIPSSVTSIGAGAFSNTGLTELTIPQSITSISEGTFLNCSSLNSLTIGDSVTHIGARAFEMCNSLTSLVIPAGVISIGEWAFAGCTSLADITIPNSVTEILGGAFGGCGSLTALNVSVDHPIYTSEDGVLFNKDKTTLIYYPTGKTGNYVIPNSVARFGEYAFYYCENLTSITIPANVTTIAEGVFSDCSNLTSVSLPVNLANIGDYAFYSCGSLTAITIPESVTHIGMGAFGYSGLTTISIPNGITTIKYESFYGCSSLASVIIPEGVTSIDRSAFYESGLTYVVIPSSVTSIGEYAFGDCDYLTEITVNATIPPSITDYTFYGVDYSIPLYVPAGTLGAYQSDTYWGEFINVSVNTTTAIPQVNLIESVHTQHGSIIIENETILPVTIYDVVGRLVASGSSLVQSFTVPNAGVYIVKVGEQTMKVIVP
jgi:hypothetical protein